MKYILLLADTEPETEPDYESPEFAAEMEQWFAFTNEIQEAGAMLGGEALMPSDTATCVRVRNGETLTQDGPFAETKEALGGFYLIDVADLDEAIAWAAKVPNVVSGTVEIRPIMDTGD